MIFKQYENTNNDAPYDYEIKIEIERDHVPRMIFTTFATSDFHNRSEWGVPTNLFVCALKLSDSTVLVHLRVTDFCRSFSNRIAYNLKPLFVHMHCTFWGDPLLGAVCSNTFLGLQFTGKQAFSSGGRRGRSTAHPNIACFLLVDYSNVNDSSNIQYLLKLKAEHKWHVTYTALSNKLV